MFSRLPSLLSWGSQDEGEAPVTRAKMGQTNTSYYDHNLKRWRFAGEEDQEPDLTVTPPPTASEMKKVTTNKEVVNKKDTSKKGGIDTSSLCTPPSNPILERYKSSAKPNGALPLVWPPPAEPAESHEGEEHKEDHEACGESAPASAPHQLLRLHAADVRPIRILSAFKGNSRMSPANALLAILLAVLLCVALANLPVIKAVQVGLLLAKLSVFKGTLLVLSLAKLSVIKLMVLMVVGAIAAARCLSCIHPVSKRYKASAILAV